MQWDIFLKNKFELIIKFTKFQLLSSKFQIVHTFE